MEREQFTFYRSFYDAISELDDEAQLAAYRSIVSYALTGELPQLSGIVSAVFKLVRPVLDTAAKKSEGGIKGRCAKTPERPSKDNGKITQRPLKDTAKTTERLSEDTEKTSERPLKDTAKTTERPSKDQGNKKEGEKEKEKESECSPPCIPPTEKPDIGDLPEGVQSAVLDWLAYKRERHEAYKPIGQTAFLNAARQHTQIYGEAATVGVIRSAMASGYKGVPWDRLARGQPEKPEKKKQEREEWKQKMIGEYMGECGQ